MSRLNFIDVTNENRDDFHRLMRIYAKELDENQHRSTAPEILEKWTDSIILRQHDKGRYLKLCHDGTTLTGFVFGKIDLPDDKGYKKIGYGYIMEFFVLPEHRRRGFGREMLRRLQAFFAANGADRMYLTADPVTGVPFWEKMGFVRTGEISPENGLEIFEKEVRDSTVSITVSDYLTRELAVELAATQWNRAEWSDRVTDLLYGYKTKSDAFNVIARADDELIGRLQCLQSVDEPRLWYYGDLFVKPAFRRRHIGDRMLQTALDVLRDKGCRTLRCYVEPDNIPSLNLQRKRGFSEKPFLLFDELVNDGRLMFERELCGFKAAPAGAPDALYICDMYEKSIAELHGAALGERERPAFFAEIKQMLTDRDPDEENFLIYCGAVPCCWVKVNGLESGGTGWISMLIVEPKFRRRGAGGFAVNFALKFLAKRGKKLAKIKTTEDNFPALSLYQSLGFFVSESSHAVSGDGKKRIYITLDIILL